MRARSALGRADAASPLRARLEHRCKLSDGEQFILGMMSSDLAQQVKQNSIVKITECTREQLNDTTGYAANPNAPTQA